jgi:hypothetical protein
MLNATCTSCRCMSSYPACPTFLQETNIVVDKMQRELNELQPVLAAKTQDTERLLVQVGAKQ